MRDTISHPDGLFCQICGCGEIYYWPEVEEEWETMTEEEKNSYEICPACYFGGTETEFPYEEFE